MKPTAARAADGTADRLAGEMTDRAGWSDIETLAQPPKLRCNWCQEEVELPFVSRDRVSIEPAKDWTLVPDEELVLCPTCTKVWRS